MLRLVLAGVLCFIASGSPATAIDPLEDANGRVDELLRYAEKMRQKYSVTCKHVKVVKSTVSQEVDFVETLFRKVNVYRNGKPSVRFDSRISDAGPVNQFEASLALPSKILWGFDIKHQMRIESSLDNKPVQTNQLTLIDPFTICMNVLGFYSGANATEEGWRDSHIYEAAYTRDGRLKCRKIHKKGLAVAEFVFEKDLPFIVEHRVYIRTDTSKPVDYLEVSRDEVKGWPEIGHSKTSWRKLADDSYVPTVFFAVQDHSILGNKYPQVEEVEIRFENWKFGDKVEIDLLDEKTFTSEELAKHINFDDLEQQFVDRPKEQRR